MSRYHIVRSPVFHELPVSATLRVRLGPQQHDHNNYGYRADRWACYNCNIDRMLLQHPFHALKFRRPTHAILLRDLYPVCKEPRSMHGVDRGHRRSTYHWQWALSAFGETSPFVVGYAKLPRMRGPTRVSMSTSREK